jgi:hypothetical protein
MTGEASQELSYKMRAISSIVLLALIFIGIQEGPRRLPESVLRGIA